MTERILSLPRMARRLGVTQQWLRREAEANRIPVLRADKRLLFEPEAVEAEIARRAAEPRQGGANHAE